MKDSILNVPLVFALSFFFLIEGCTTIPPGTGLSRGIPVSNTIEKNAWLSKVNISDSSIAYPDTVQESFSINLLEYLEERKYFKNVNILPGNLKEGDIVLFFDFDHFQQERSVHPAYIPGAILTLGLYIIFGGPMFTDSSNFSGTIKIENYNGHQISNAEAEYRDENNLSIWTVSTAIPNAIELRTQIVNELLEKAIVKLNEKGEENK